MGKTHCCKHSWHAGCCEHSGCCKHSGCCDHAGCCEHSGCCKHSGCCGCHTHGHGHFDGHHQHSHGHRHGHCHEFGHFGWGKCHCSCADCHCSCCSCCGGSKGYVHQHKGDFKTTIGVKKYRAEELDVKVVGNEVIVHGKHADETGGKDESFQPEFTRRIALGDHIDPNTVAACLAHGELAITASEKAAEGEPHQVNIHVA